MLSIRDTGKKKRGRAWPFAAATVGAFLLLGATATEARADSNFKRGFEDQLGRIVAYETVNLGKQILFRGVAESRHGDHYRDGDHYRVIRYEDDRRHRNPYRKRRWAYVPRHDHEYAYDRERHDYRHERRDHVRQHRHDRHCKARYAY